MVSPGWMPGAYQSLSITPPPQLDTGERNMTKGSWIKIRTRRDYSPISIMGKTSSTWGN